MWGHVFDDLAAYAESQLDDTRRAKVERHLAACPECRASLDRVREGIALASQLMAAPMPDDVAARIRAGWPVEASGSGGRSGATGTRGIIRGQPWIAAAAVLVIGAALGLYWQLNRPWVEMERVATAPTFFELEGQAVHRAVREAPTALSFQSDDEQAVWAWLASQGAPVTSMTIVRPPAERARFVPVGATVRTLGGVQASVVSYRIDGRPVTLALARAHEVADAPPAGWWTKRVTHRRGSDGVNSLTWTVGGGTYVMASELDGAGQRACQICHTSATFANAISRLTR